MRRLYLTRGPFPRQEGKKNSNEPETHCSKGYFLSRGRGGGRIPLLHYRKREHTMRTLRDEAIEKESIFDNKAGGLADKQGIRTKV